MSVILASAPPLKKRIVRTDRSKIRYPAGNWKEVITERAAGRRGDGIGKNRKQKRLQRQQEQMFWY